MPRSIAWLAALAVLGSTVVATDVLAPAEEASAQFATGGVGQYPGLIDWVTWSDTHGTAITVGATGTTTRTIGSQDLTTTCEVISITGGAVIAHRSGGFAGDGLDDLYNVGGTGTNNQMVTGLANFTAGETISIDVDCTTTLGGVPVPVQGLVFAEAEASTSTGGEYVQATPDGPVTWRVIERYREPGCTQSTAAVLDAGGTLRLQPTGTHCGAELGGSAAGPVAIAFMEGASSAVLEVHGGGRSAVALGVVLGADFGDAPATYGEAAALIAPTWTGGEISEGTTDLFTGFDLGTPTPPSIPRLGASVEADPSQPFSTDATGDGAEEDGISVPATLEVARGGSYTLTDVECTGPGTVAGWIDWNRNGTFEPGERSDAVDCEDGTVDLTWTVTADAVSALGDDRSFLRLRIVPLGEAPEPTGFSTAGEVEDFAITVDVEDAPLECPANAPGLLYQSSPTHRYEVDLATGEYEDQFTYGRTFNAMGYNQLDGLIYGYVSGAASSPAVAFQMVRMGSGGVVNLGRPAGVQDAVAYHIGDVDNNGHYWMSSGTIWYQIDLTTATPTVLDSGTHNTLPGIGFGADWAYVPGGGDYLYRVMNDGSQAVLVGFNRTTHLLENLGALPDVPSEQFGAVYAGPGGYLYASSNVTGLIYRIDVNTGVGVEFAQGPVSNTNDGARCATSPLQIDFGDAPASYGTSLEDDGPRHTVNGYDTPTATADLMLGTTVDLENDGQPSATANGDDAAGIDDEDGVTAPIVLYIDQQTAVNVTVTNNTAEAATLAGWIDLNDDGSFDASELQTLVVPANSGQTTQVLTFPAVSTPGDGTFARFRVYPGEVAPASLSPLGSADGGEVEDYPVVGPVPVPDFGDAPDSYGTTSAADGAAHLLADGPASLRLGAQIDADLDGQPSIGADGDDLTGVDDEDGVRFNTEVSIPDRVETVFVTASGAGYLNAWIDFDLNGEFDANERIFADEPVVAGVNMLRYDVPSGDDFVAGDSYARFRITSDPGAVTEPTGLAPDGEVEDYTRTLFDAPGTALEQCPVGTTPVPVSIIQNPSFEDRTGNFANSSAASTIGFAEYWDDSHATGGQYHYFDPPAFDSGPGAATMPVRAGADGFAFEGGHSGLIGAAAAGEGATNVLAQALNPDATYVGFFSMAAGGYSREGDGYMNFYGTSDPDVGHYPGAGVVVPTAANTELLYSTPVVRYAGAGVDPIWEVHTFQLEAGQAWPYLRVEVRNETPANNATVAGQVWMNFDDFHMFECDPVQDFGDAPASYGTLLEDDGPRHRIIDHDADTNTAPIMLGASIDSDDDGQPSTDALGDGASDDGVVFNPGLGYANPTLRTGLDPNTLGPVENTLEVTASADGFVSVWVDWNQDGDFDDAGEQVASAQPVTAGSNDVTFDQGTNPAGISSYVRVRYSTDAASIATPHGPAPDGEVEDYRVLFERLIQPDACVINDSDYYAFTFAQPVNLTGTGGVGSTALYQNVAVVGGVPVDMFVEVVAGSTNPSQIPPNGIGVAADDAVWLINIDATLRYTFSEAGTTNPVAINAVYAVSDLDSNERATFSSADLAGYAVTQGSAVTIIESGGTTTFEGNGSWTNDPESRFQIVLEGISTMEVHWQGGSNSGFFFDGDGDFGIAPPACEDFGDAPASYGTLLADDGARHTIVPGLRLGDTIDFDPDGQATPGADGDNLNRLADEDGVVFNPSLGYGTPTLRTGLDPNTLGPVENTLEVTASADGFVSVWVDWNQDGDFDDAGEQVASAQPVTAGSNDVTFDQGTNPDEISSYVRVRYSTDAASISTPYGPAPDGEVEDYQVLFERLVQPDACVVNDAEYFAFTFSEPTERTGTGGVGSSARYSNVTVIGGIPVDMTIESIAGTLNPSAAPPNGLGVGGGPVAGIIDEDDARWQINMGATLRYAFYVAGTTTPIEINGVFTVNDMDTSEIATFLASDLAGYAVTQGSGVSIAEPGTAVQFAGNGGWNGDPQSRFQIVLEGIDTFEVMWQGGSNSGFGFDGDGDLSIQPPACSDFGDAPDSYGTTLDASGARHLIVPGLRLGDTIDFDPDGQPSPGADTDDLNRLADEDGVASEIVLTTGQPTTVSVSATNNTAADATLAGWIDLDLNGTFDAGELITIVVPANSGTQSYQLVFPAGDPGADTYARFRLFPAGDIVAPTGEATGGEVEDYPVTFLETELEIEKTSDATVDSRPGDVITYTVTAENTGTGDYTAAFPAIVSDDLSGVLDDANYEGDAVATIGGSAAGPVSILADVLSWQGALASGETVTITYSVTLGSNGDGEVRNVAWAGGGDVPECDPPVDGVDPVTGQPCAENSFPLPRLTIEKSADTTDLPADGGTVNYTVTVTNVGDGDYTVDAPAVVTDDLTEVLDDIAGPPTGLAATIDGSPTTAPTFSSPELTWSGPLASGEVLEITYSVTYDDSTGDNVLRNVVCVDPAEAAPGAPACDFVQIPGSGLTQWKQVETSDTPPVAGSTMTYTLFFSNDGATDAAVDARDDLTHVLDDAIVTTPPSSPDGLVTDLVGNFLGITGTVPVGATYTVQYTVTVLPDDQRGDDIAANFLFEREPGGEFPPPPPGPDCTPTDAQFPDCTVTSMPAIEFEKSVEASTPVLGEGTVLTYTITVRNTGEATGTVSKLDNLSGVLDDAELTTVPGSDTPSVIVSSVSGGEFSIGGTLAAGGVAVITYQVTVLPQGERGDGVMQNFLLDPGEEPPVECLEGDPECTTTYLPFIVPSKSVDPASGTDVAAGAVLTYTLSFENTGLAAGEVDFTDLLAGIVDDGVVSDLTIVLGPLDAERVGEEILVTGVLPAGGVATITYVVTVGADGERGDNSLGNFLVVTGEEPPEECATDDPTCTTNDISEIIRWKTVTPSTTPVEAGTVLTYNVFVENIGEGAGSVDFIDDLTHVLDDADVTMEPSSGILSSPRTGVQIAISGTVEAGVTAVVTYQVTIGPDGERGDDIAANFLLETDEVPPVDPVCVPEDGELADCTTTGIGHLDVTKSVSASTNPVGVGTELTYTLTFENVGTAPVTVDKVDDLSDVLDDATLEDAPAASDDALTASAVVDDAFTVTGELTAGQVVTVQYSVIVNPITDRGNDSAVNFVLNPGEEPPAECDPAVAPCTVTDLPRIVISKSVVASTDPVATGTVLTYTIEFHNLGLADGAVDKVDDLSGVLDDADLTTSPLADDPALTASAVIDDEFSITGTLVPGQLVHVTYEVTVRDETERGDSRASNFVLDPGETPPGECDPEVVPCTETEMPELHDSKSVTPVSGTPIVAGQQLTYTLEFRNEGTADGVVDRVDDLTHVLDDADFIAGPTVSDAALSATGPDAANRIAITGTLEPGQTVTVEYTIEVRATGERGDDVIANFVLDPTEEPPAEPVCEPASGEDPDCTLNPVGEILPLKYSNPESFTDVSSGSEITYTLLFENVGAGTAAIDYVDYLDGVLDDADFTGEVTADAGLTATGPTDGVLRVTGTVAPGAVAMVTYVVTVLPYGEQGDHLLGNFLVLDGFDPPTLCDADDPLCTMHPVPPPPPGLALTGMTLGISAGVALVLLLGGAMLIVVQRQRRREQRGA